MAVTRDSNSCASLRSTRMVATATAMIVIFLTVAPAAAARRSEFGGRLLRAMLQAAGVEHTITQHQTCADVYGYNALPNTDFTGSDLSIVHSGDLPAAAMACLVDDRCIGFNSLGHVKQAASSTDQGFIESEGVCFYSKADDEGRPSVQADNETTGEEYEQMLAEAERMEEEYEEYEGQYEADYGEYEYEEDEDDDEETHNGFQDEDYEGMMEDYDDEMTKEAEEYEALMDEAAEEEERRQEQAAASGSHEAGSATAGKLTLDARSTDDALF